MADHFAMEGLCTPQTALSAEHLVVDRMPL